MSLRLRRLASDYEAMRRLAHLHPRVQVEGVAGNPPERYRLVLRVRSLQERMDKIVVVGTHRLEIALPAGYPRDPPVCRMLTPVFHPNIAPHAVCIGDHWTAAESLDLMVQRVGEMLAYQSYNVKSPLNGRAAKWAEENLHRLPVDKEPFFVDLESAAPAPAGRACSNCGRTDAALAPCGGGHDLCPDCDTQCPGCGAVLCLACGRTSCDACQGAPCANCGNRGGSKLDCRGGHTLCGDCEAVCPTCGRKLCTLCAEYPCRACSPV